MKNYGKLIIVSFMVLFIAFFIGISAHIKSNNAVVVVYGKDTNLVFEIKNNMDVYVYNDCVHYDFKSKKIEQWNEWMIYKKVKLDIEEKESLKHQLKFIKANIKPGIESYSSDSVDVTVYINGKRYFTQPHKPSYEKFKALLKILCNWGRACFCNSLIVNFKNMQI